VADCKLMATCCSLFECFNIIILQTSFLRAGASQLSFQDKMYVIGKGPGFQCLSIFLLYVSESGLEFGCISI
jgi:hypothetical protein